LIELARDLGFAKTRSFVPLLGPEGGELQRVYEAAADTTADEIACATELEVGRVAAALSELELEALVECPRGRWRHAEAASRLIHLKR
jgi:predicted Rossmann fold nucleotide-binding protein DprA/Smf involved in DNA uptake